MRSFYYWCAGLAAFGLFMIFVAIYGVFMQPTGRYDSEGYPIYQTDKAAVVSFGDSVMQVIKWGILAVAVIVVVVGAVWVIAGILAANRRQSERMLTMIEQGHRNTYDLAVRVIDGQQAHIERQSNQIMMLSATAVRLAERGYFAAPASTDTGTEREGIVYLWNPSQQIVDHHVKGLSDDDVLLLAEHAGSV